MACRDGGPSDAPRFNIGMVGLHEEPKKEPKKEPAYVEILR